MIKPILGFIASSGARMSGPVRKFVSGNQSKLAEFNIHTTGGTYRDLFAKHASDLEITQLKPGDEGGVVEIAAKIVTGECKTLLYFSDPLDPKAFLPENRVLIRQSIVQDIDLILNPAGAAIWAQNSNQSFALALAQQTLALISHDEKKLNMFEFVGQHLKELGCFERIICTGTTGTRIQNAFPALAKIVTPFKSGPKGGDVQIAAEIIEGKCQHAVFFIDPDNPHPHTADIDLFIRTCHQFRGVEVNFLPTRFSAERWMKTIKV